MERVKGFLKQVKTSSGKIVDMVNLDIVYSNTDPANMNSGLSFIPFFPFGKHPHYIVETEEGTESFPKIDSEFERGEEVLIVETCYCGIPMGKELKKKSSNLPVRA